MRAVRAVWRLLVWATLAAGLVGMTRQRVEYGRIRRGLRPPVTAATRTAAPTREGPLGARLASWAPGPPRTRVGRLATTVWASPVTAVGFLIGLSTGARPRWDAEHAVVVFENGGTGAIHALRAVGAGANAVGQVVVSDRPITPLLLAHEVGHVRQAERLGVLLFPLYLWLWGRYGYRDHPLERSARVAARQWLAAQQRPAGAPTTDAVRRPARS